MGKLSKLNKRRAYVYSELKSTQIKEILTMILTVRFYKRKSELKQSMPKVLCKPHYGNSHLEMVVCKWGAPH